MEKFNDFTYSLFKNFNFRIEILIKNDADFLMQARKNFDDFLMKIHNANNALMKYIETEKRKPQIRVDYQYKNIYYGFFIFQDLSSSFKIKISTTSEMKNPPTYVLEKLKTIYGYVYFLKSEFGYKIGFASKLKQRLRTFGVKLPFKFELHSTIKTPQYKALEIILHDLLKEKNVNGEWFSIDDEDFKNIDIILKNMKLERKLFDEKRFIGE